MSFSINNLPENGGMVSFRAEAGGASAVKFAGGASFEVGTGVPTGTTGTDGFVGIYAHTDGKIYVENRVGFAVNCFISPLTFQVQGI